jgi:hypothetical protein
LLKGLLEELIAFMSARNSSFPFPLHRRRDASKAASTGGWARSIPPTRSRWAFSLLAAGSISMMGTWLGVRTLPWFGPLVADTLRSVVGSENVTRLEEAVADVEDRVKSVSTTSSRSLTETTPDDLIARNAEPNATAPVNTKPADITPPFPKVASAEDGVWRPIALRNTESHAVHQTLIHPDPTRRHAELFVFALDLSKLEVHAVAGSIEPKAPGRFGAGDRPGVIPEANRDKLVAAFNGGFKAEHGHFGMMVNGKEILPPKPTSCTIAARDDGSIAVGSWPALQIEAETFSWWRQTPACMVESGTLHAGLANSKTKNWGATLEGETVIRRSALGVSKDGRTLFMGISNSTTARALALGMQAVGSDTVAQLDVNFSFPRFLLYRNDEDTGATTAKGAVNGLLYTPDEFLGHASTRDFFYVTTK